MSIFINKRLINEYKRILEQPIENIITHPTEDNILEWYYLIKSDKNEYSGGEYMGKLEFSEEYPMKPPKITMITPSGRFETNTRLCLSISDFHPESWNPSWNVETILIGLYSFMLSEEYSEGTIGSIKDTVENRKKYAKESIEFNNKQEIYIDLFKNNDLLDINSGYLGKTESEIKSCRYCFEKGGNLIAPCACKGGNKWVHTKCLRKWQYTSILSQSTHPDFQTSIEKKCNVCQSEFNIKEITRDTLMLEFTGDEIANMIHEGYYIVSGEKSSRHNTEILEKYRGNKDLVNSISHWTNAVFLITNIVKADTNNRMKDGIHGVSITRKISLESHHGYFSIWQNFAKYYNNYTNLVINHFIGGPCEPNTPFGLIRIRRNMISREELNRIGVGVVSNLTENNEDIQFVFGNVYVIFEIIRQVFTAIILTNNNINLNVFWGLAGWGRTQLLGEIARGGWGLMRARHEEILPWKNGIWTRVTEKKLPIFAGENDFSESYHAQS